MLKLMWRTESLEKTLILGMIEGRKRAWQDEMVGWHHQLNAHEFEEAPGVDNGREAQHAAGHGDAKRHDWATELTDNGDSLSCAVN